MEENPAQWAIDLLERKRNIERSVLGYYSPEIFITCVAFGGPMAWNFYGKRPLFAALPIHILGASVGIVLAQVFKYVRSTAYVRQDAIMLDYIKHHPERFPPPENRKYADIFKRWKPAR